MKLRKRLYLASQPLHLPLTIRYHAIVIRVYALSLDADDEIRKGYYSKLNQVLLSACRDNKIILLGDFSTRVAMESELWKEAFRKEGVAKVNSNGNLLLSKCLEHDLIVAGVRAMALLEQKH